MKKLFSLICGLLVQHSTMKIFFFILRFYFLYFHFADKSSCNKFYQCSNGTAFAKTCSDGLVWNTQKSECDWRDKTNCGARPITISGGSAGMTQCQCQQGAKSCYQMNAATCNGFIHCSAGKKYEKLCPSKLRALTGAGL